MWILRRLVQCFHQVLSSIWRDIYKVRGCGVTNTDHKHLGSLLGQRLRLSYNLAPKSSSCLLLWRVLSEDAVSRIVVLNCKRWCIQKTIFLISLCSNSVFINSKTQRAHSMPIPLSFAIVDRSSVVQGCLEYHNLAWRIFAVAQEVVT